MTADSALAVQTALYERLCADAALVALVGPGGVRDHVPPGTPFPYVVFGGMSSRPLDAQDSQGCELVAELHVFSRAQGMAETKKILATLRDALHGVDFPVTGHKLILCLGLGAETRRADDGLTCQGIARFRIITEPQ